VSESRSEDDAAPATAAPPPRRRRWGRWVGGAAVALVVLVALVLVGARLAVNTGMGRAEVARLLDGLPLGPVGRLHVEGVAGDPLSDLKLARLQIVDAKGPWLDAHGLELRWRPGALFGRRFHATAFTAAEATVLRDPVLAAQPPGKGAGKLPVAIQIDRLGVRLHTLPAFSGREGLYDIDGGFALERSLAAQGRLAVASRLHAGDGLNATFQLGEHGRMQAKVDAVEGQGGALAGMLGLAPGQPLDAHAVAAGTTTDGTFSLRTALGADQPFRADASWRGGTGRLTAHLELAASRLTRDLAAKAGPVADLTLDASHRHADTYTVAGRLVTQAASLGVQGPVDWKRRTTPGLAATLQVADLHRWAPAVDIGPARLAGQVSGAPDDFLFKGRIDASRLAQSGYALAQAGGPLTLGLHARAWSLQADLTGAGGAGKGLLPALAGSAPHVKIDAARLADGRLLVKSLDARSAQLTLTGQGGQGLLGGLSFKGSATLVSVGVLKPGARGRLDADWTAEQPKGAKAWSFAFDAHAGGLALGVPAADHFLGGAPKLHAEAAYGPDGLAVKAANVTGAFASANLAGRLDPKGAMAFDVGWEAAGPFDAGPLQIAGAARGTGKLTGTLSDPHAELDTQVASLALGRLVVAPARLALTLGKSGSTLGGTVALNGPSAYGPAMLKAAFEVAGGGVAVHDLVADAGGVKAQGSLALNGGAPSSADLRVAAGPGAFLSAGQVQGQLKLAQGAGGLMAHLVLSGEDVVAPELRGAIHRLQLHADGPFDRLPFQLVADSETPIPWSVSGSGRFDQGADGRQLTFAGAGAVHGASFKTLRPAVLRVAGETRQIDLGLAVGGGRAEVSAHQTGQALSGEARLTGVNLSTLDPDYAGSVTGDLTLTGGGAALSGVLDAALTGARTRDAPANLALDGHVHADLAGQRLRLSAAATNAEGLKSNIQVDLPAVATAAPFRIAIDRTRPIAGQFSADGELRPLWDLLIGGDQQVSGHLNTAGTLAGTLNAPSVLGHAALDKGRYQNFAVGLDLQDFTARADFDREAVRISQVSGADGAKGTLSGSGDIGLVKGGGSTFALKLNRFKALDNDLGSATMSGAITVTRDASGQAKLTGKLTVDRADIAPSTPTPTGVVSMDVVEINKPGETAAQRAAARTAAAKTRPPPPVVLDLAVTAPRGVFVKGKGLDVELSLDAHVTGSAAAPDLTGEARVVLGSYDFAGKRFDFDNNSVVHLAAQPDRIRLDLTATLQETTLTAQVHVTGTAARPEIKLTSTPTLPPDEVLSQVLFGSSAAQLTGSQAAELASTLASLSGGGGFDVLGRLRQFAGLDRLAFGQGVSGTGVSGGKYVTDSVYVELTGGGREGPSASVEWRVKRNFSIISSVGTQGDTQLSIQYRRTFH
jgi:translocation and assembly module TamB